MHSQRTTLLARGRNGCKNPCSSTTGSWSSGLLQSRDKSSTAPSSSWPWTFNNSCHEPPQSKPISSTSGWSCPVAPRSCAQHSRSGEIQGGSRYASERAERSSVVSPRVGQPLVLSTAHHEQPSAVCQSLPLLQLSSALFLKVLLQERRQINYSSRFVWVWNSAALLTCFQEGLAEDIKKELSPWEE